VQVSCGRTFELAAQHHRAVVCLVVRGVHQRHWSLRHAMLQSSERLRGSAAPQLPPVARGKLVEPGRIVAEPPAKVGARGNVLQPGVESQIGLPHTAGPQTVHEHPITIVRRCRFVCALELDPGAPHGAEYVAWIRAAPRDHAYLLRVGSGLDRK